MPFVLRFPCLSICLSVLPFLLLLLIPMFYQVSISIPCTVTMAIPGLWRHSAVVQCLCPFFFNFYSFSLLCLADYEWIKQFCVNLQSSFDFDIFYIFNVSFCFLVVFGLFIFLQLISFWSSSFHSLHNIAYADRGNNLSAPVMMRKGAWDKGTDLDLRTVKGACKGREACRQFSMIWCNRP